MLVQEYGPFGLFVRVREFAGIGHDASGKPETWHENNVLACVYCTSVWVAPVMLRFPKFARVMAISALAILVSKLGEK